MMRALVWKEWREQRPVALAGLVVSVLLPVATAVTLVAGGRPVDLESLAVAVLAFDVGFLWPLFAAIAGAMTVAHERGEGTLDFLLTRPVGRGAVWWSKLLLALAAWGAVVAGSLAIGIVMRLAAGDTPLAIDPVILDEMVWPVVPLAGFSVLLLGAAVFCSTFFSRAMTAAGAALCVALLIAVSVLAVWMRLDFFLRPDPYWIALEYVLLGGLLLAASLAAFSRGEARALSRGRQAAWLGAAVAGGLVVAALPVLATRAEIDPASARIVSAVLAPAGDVAVAGLAHDDGRSAQVWAVPTDGRPAFALARRPSWPVAVSPDGAWALYLSARGPFGLRADTLELRAARLDGGEDRLLAGGLDVLATLRPGPGPFAPSAGIAVSPDGRRVALLQHEGRLLLVPFAGGPAETVVLPPFETRTWDELLGWASVGREVVILRHGSGGPREGMSRAAVVAIDVATGDHRTLLDAGIIHSIDPAGGAALATPVVIQALATETKMLPLTVRERDCPDGRGGWCLDVRLELLEVSSGRRRVVASSRHLRHWGADWDAQRGRLAYLEHATLHVYDAATGRDLTWLTLPGEAHWPVWSPGGTHVAVRLLGGHRGPQGVAVAGPGTVLRTFDGPWRFGGWSGRNRVVLVGWGDDSALAVGDVDTGEVRRVFPPAAGR